MPCKGEMVFLFRESTYWYEAEIYKVNVFKIAEWLEFCQKNKILYWCYLEDINNLVARPIMTRKKRAWYTPDLPLFDNPEEQNG